MKTLLLTSAAALTLSLSPALAEYTHHDNGAGHSIVGSSHGDTARGRGGDRGREDAPAFKRAPAGGAAMNARGTLNARGEAGAPGRRGYGRAGAAAWGGTGTMAVRPTPGQDQVRTGGTLWQTARGSDRHDNRGGRTNVFMGRGQHWGQHIRNNAFASLRHTFHARQRYHAGAYYQPAGWYYRQWNVGAFLPAMFFSQNYWLQDYSIFGLTPPPYGTVWVRYGSDALLIDQDTGEVIQVVYGLFY